jgi:head-tail adaptor
MNNGDRDQLITIETPAHTGDGFGGIATTVWSTHAQSWCNVRAVQAREDERQGALRASCMYLITGLREELKAITGEMRVSWDGQVLNIREIRLPPEREQLMVFTAESGVAV